MDYEKNGLVDPNEVVGVLKGFSKEIINFIEWDEEVPRLYEAIVEMLRREEFANGVPYPKFLSIFTTGLIANHTKEQIRSMFNFLDEDQSGTIKLDDLKRLTKDIGESITINELKDMIKNITNGNDEITFEEFYNIFKKSTAVAL